MLEHLAKCRAVCFPPYDEDYGFVTVEAFASRKAVMTCTDSGGPAELVVDDVNGKVCAPRPEALAVALRELMDDAATAERLGQAGSRAGVRDDMVARRQSTADRHDDASPASSLRRSLGILLLAFAVSVDFPKANGGGFKGDESTYYVLAHSLARDFDFQYERKDLMRVWEEFPGPEGIFLKTGKDVEIRGSSAFPFFRWVKREDPERDTRLYFSKSYIYPLVAAPFVVLFGTNGFLVLHAILIAFDLLVIYLFVLAATKSNWVALPMAIAFLGASVVPGVFRLAHAGAVQFFARAVRRVFLGVQGGRAASGPQPCSRASWPARRRTTLRRFSSAWRRSRSRRTCWCWCRSCCSRPAGANGNAPRR